MPRQDVPYGGAICRLRERIAEIWDKLGEKLHSINGVEGDGQGNVLIRSDSAALTITDDQVQHEIVLDLDTSQLPAADVNSVNGQTGAVALTADDIPSDNGDVQTDLDNLAAADTTLQGNINAEALARQNADSTLQTNINAEAAARTSAIAAAITANNQYVVLTTGNQTAAGFKFFIDMGIGEVIVGGNTERWIRIAHTTISDSSWVGFVIPDKAVSTGLSMEFFTIVRSNMSVFKARNTLGTLNTSLFYLTYDGSEYELWYHYAAAGTNYRLNVIFLGKNAGRGLELDGVTEQATLDPTSYVWAVNPTVI